MKQEKSQLGNEFQETVFKPTQKNLSLAILDSLQKMLDWHDENGHGPMPDIDNVLDSLIAVRSGAFTLLIEDGGQEHHENSSITVFNEEGKIIDDRIWYNPTGEGKVPKKSFIGTPIINGSTPVEHKPLHRNDSVFKP